MVLPKLVPIRPRRGMCVRVNSVGEQEFSFPRLERVAVNDASYTAQDGWLSIALTALSGARTITLPLSTTLDAETIVVVRDEAGAAGSHTITVGIQGADTINGGSTLTITSNYGVLRLATNGAGGWFSV